MLPVCDFCFRAGTEKLGALQSIGKELGLSCPVKKAYPVMLYLARHFHDDFEGGVLANANVGGKRCIHYERCPQKYALCFRF